jgi:hypothetical protein
MLCTLLGGVFPAAAQTDSFDLEVKPVSDGSQISKVKILVRLTSDDPVRFSITPPGASSSLDVPESDYLEPAPDPSTVTRFVKELDEIDNSDDYVQITPPPRSDVTVDRIQYTILLALRSDYDSSVCGTSSDMTGAETWTIDVEPEGSDTKAVSACPVSFRQREDDPSGFLLR